MTEATTTVPAEVGTAVGDERSRGAAERALLREIAVGGLAGLLAGLLVGGIGGRVVMRIATLLAPDAVGRFTENGNRIGTISVDGTLALIVFAGLATGVFAGSVWVVARPWLPRYVGLRALATVPLGIGVFGFGLIQAGNPDFRILGYDPVIIAVLIALLAIGGPVLVALDTTLDRVLPHPAASDRGVIAAYAVILALGLVLTLLMTVPAYLGSSAPLVGVGLVTAGIGTLLAWAGRVGIGPGRRFVAAAAWLGRGGLVVATAVGLVELGAQVAPILARA